MLPLKRSEFLARPGFPTYYSIWATAKLLGMSRTTILAMVRAGEIKASKQAQAWQIPRSEVVRIARSFHADRPLRLARVMAGPKARLVALTCDRTVRDWLRLHNPIYCASAFSLAQTIMVRPSNIVLVDWETCGSSAAKEIADHLSVIPDRPKLVGLLPEYVSDKSKGWECLLPRPLSRLDLISTLQTLK
jgi:excisionase family DNA binding protein